MVLISLTAEKPVWCNGLLRCFAGRQIPGEGQYDLPHSLRYPEHHLQCLREKPNRTYLYVSTYIHASLCLRWLIAYRVFANAARVLRGDCKQWKHYPQKSMEKDGKLCVRINYLQRQSWRSSNMGTKWLARRTRNSDAMGSIPGSDLHSAWATTGLSFCPSGVWLICAVFQPEKGRWKCLPVASFHLVFPLKNLSINLFQSRIRADSLVVESF
jgi:hypothetical protein